MLKKVFEVLVDVFLGVMIVYLLTVTVCLMTGKYDVNVDRNMCGERVETNVGRRVLEVTYIHLVNTLDDNKELLCRDEVRVCGIHLCTIEMS